MGAWVVSYDEADESGRYRSGWAAFATLAEAVRFYSFRPQGWLAACLWSDRRSPGETSEAPN